MGELQRLLNHYIQGVRFPGVSGFEILELLDVRSSLASHENELDETQRGQLEQADSEFLRQATGFYESLSQLGELTDLRRRLAAPCSHWWWYLEKLAQRDSVKV